MELITEKINRILILLEDSQEEGDWELVKQATENLEEIYDEFERAENVFEMEY